MHDLVVANRQDKVLAEGVHHAEGEFPMMVTAVEGINGHVLQ